MRCANPQSRPCLRDPIAAQVSSVPPRILQLAASSQKPPSHRPLRRSCVTRPRMQFELLSSDCAKASHSLFGNSGAAASRLALCFGSLAACSRFCSAGIRSPRTGRGPFGSVAARCRLARSAVVSFWLSICWGSSFLNGMAMVMLPILCAARSSSSS